jgi:hypothetical protein
MKLSDLTFFVVMNSEGKYFRRKGHGGYGDTWVEDIQRARVYAKIGGARGTVTFFANEYPQYPPPSIIKMTVTATEVIDETARIQAAIAKKKKQEEEYEVKEREHKLEDAKKALERAKKRLKEVKRGK